MSKIKEKLVIHIDDLDDVHSLMHSIHDSIKLDIETSSLNYPRLITRVKYIERLVKLLQKYGRGNGNE